MDTDDTDSIESHYESLRNYARMISRGYSDLLIVDGPGGLGKTHNVIDVLSNESDDDGDETIGDEVASISSYVRQSGFVTPKSFYKQLYLARRSDTVLFLDDVNGITKSDKAIEMLKAATDTQGDENVVQYRTTDTIEHPDKAGEEIPQSFTFRGRIVMSFNETPDNPHFRAMKDRGVFYEMNFNHDERLEIIGKLADREDFSPLSVEKQREVHEWLEQSTDPTFNVTIRTFEKLCDMRRFTDVEGGSWDEMAMDMFDLDYEKHTVYQLRHDESYESVKEQREEFKERTGRGRTHYYDLLDELRNEGKLAQ